MHGMRYKPDQKLKWQMLLLTAVLLAAVWGVLAILDLFAQRNSAFAAHAHRTVLRHHADRSARATALAPGLDLPGRRLADRSAGRLEQRLGRHNKEGRRCGAG